VVARNTRQTAVDDQPDALDRNGGLGHIRGNDHFRVVVLRNGLILIPRRQFTMQRKENVSPRVRLLPDSFDRAMDLVGSRHEDEHIRTAVAARSEEHTSELQSRSDLVCRLLLEKKKK